MIDLGSGERHVDLSALDRTFAPTSGALAPVWLSDTGISRHRRGSRRRPPVPARPDGRRRPTALTEGAPVGAGLRRRRRPGGRRHRHQRPARRDVALGAGEAMSDGVQLTPSPPPYRPRSAARLGALHVAVHDPTPAPTGRSTPGSCAPPASTRRSATRCCSTCTAARTPVRRVVLRRGPDPGRGRLRRRDEQPARVERPRAGVGPGDHGSQAPDRAGLGLGRRRPRRRARGARRRARALRVLRPGPGRDARRQLRRLHGHAARRATTATASGRSAANGPSTTCCRRSGPATSARSSGPSTGRTTSSDPDEYTRMSPSRLAADIHVPMLLIHSEQDYRCPINQAEELWSTLRAARTRRDLLPVPRREPRAVAVGFAGPPQAARRDHPRLVRRAIRRVTRPLPSASRSDRSELRHLDPEQL